MTPDTPTRRGDSPLSAVRRFLADEALRQLPPDALWARFRDLTDGDALRVFLERVGGRVAARCRAVTGDPALADDALQDALVQLVTHRARIPGHGAAVAWLYRAADRRARMLVRGRRRAGKRDAAAARPEAVADPRPADFESLTAAVAGLPGRQRRAVELVYLEGMTHAEAADALGVSRGAVGVCVSRGVKRLRNQLGPAGLGGALLAGGLAPERAAAMATTALTAAAGGWGLKAWVAAAAATAALGLGSVVALRPHPAPPAVAAAASPTAPESLPERNLRLFDELVRADLQAALDGMAVGDGGHAVLTAVEAHGARLWVSAELRHGPPQTHVTRFELVFDTHHRQRRFFENTLGFWRTANPRDPLMASRNRLGIPDRTRPTTGLRAVEAAFHRLPPDPRSAVESDADRTAMHAAMSRYFGDWGGGRAVRSPAGGFRTDGGAAEFAGGPIDFLYWTDLRVRPDGAVVGYRHGLRGPAVFAADGRGIDWGDGRSWVRDATSNGGER